MENFTPIASLIGGVLIGLSAAALLLFNGKIAGVSGIVSGLLHPTQHDTLWRGAFIGGLVSGGFVLTLFIPEVFAINVTRSWQTFAVAGLLVGFGARLGNGCTSGHGVCGIGRGSWRSFVATGLFMLMGAVVVYVVNHILGGTL